MSILELVKNLVHCFWAKSIIQRNGSFKFSKCFVKFCVFFLKINSNIEVQGIQQRPECTVPSRVVHHPTACPSFPSGHPGFFQLVLDDVMS